MIHIFYPSSTPISVIGSKNRHVFSDQKRTQCNEGPACKSVNQPPYRIVCARSPPFRKLPGIIAPLRLCYLRAASSIGVNIRIPSIRNTVSIHSNLAFRDLVVPVVFPCESFVTKPGLSDGGLLSCDQGVQCFLAPSPIPRPMHVRNH